MTSGEPPSGRGGAEVRGDRGDDDAVWAELVARIGPLRRPEALDEARDGRPPVDDGPEDRGDLVDGEPAAAGPAAAPGAGGHGPRDHAPPGPADAAGVDAEDRYVPPDAEPLGSAGMAWWAPWIALVGAPVVLGLVALTRASVPGWLILGCVGLFAAGAVAAVLRLPSAATQDPGDDGARL